MYLDDCKSLISTKFLPDWVREFDFSEPTTLSTNKINFATYLKNFTGNFFTELNLSLLCGEYIIDPDYLTKIDNIDSLIQQIPDTLEVIDNVDLRNKYSSDILNSIISPIRLALIQLKKFSKQITRYLDQQDDLYVLFDALSYKGINDNIPEKNDFEIDTNQLFQVFYINLQISIADHRIALNRSLLSDLLLYKKELDEIKNVDDFYFTIIKDKCNYLIKKIGIKFNEDKKRYLYAFDFEDRELLVSELQINSYSKFDNITAAHYENNQSANNALTKQIKETENRIRKFEKLSFLDYHTLIKHYKDDYNNLEQVKNLIQEFENVYRNSLKNANNDFDIRAYRTVYNYMLNNQLSLMLNQNHNYENILLLIDKINQVQNETKIKNFFPYLRFSIYLKTILEEEYKKETPSLEKLQSLTKKLEETLQRAFENFNWCKERHFLAYQAPYNESIISIIDKKNTSIKLFLASSFVLPINYEKVTNEIQELEREKNKYKTLFDVSVHIGKQKKEFAEMKTRIEQTDRRQIEILSIFAAIVLFVSANIQIFTKVTSAIDAIHFMFIFTYSMGVFVILIWMVTRTSSLKISKIHWFFIIAYVIVTYLAIASFTNWLPFNQFAK